MPTRSVFCIATSRGRADCILNELLRVEAPGREISVLFSADSGGGTPRRETGLDTATTAGRANEAIRGVLSWVDGAGPLTVPGVGRFIGAGPLVAAMNGHGSAAPIASVAEGLANFGIPSSEAGRYAGRIAMGDILIAVRTESADEADRARTVFAGMAAHDIFTIVDVTAPKTTHASPLTRVRSPEVWVRPKVRRTLPSAGFTRPELPLTDNPGAPARAAVRKS